MCSDGGMMGNGEYGITSRKACPIVTLYAIYFTLTALGLNPGVCCETPAFISFLETELPFLFREQNQKRKYKKKQMKVTASVEEFRTKEERACNMRDCLGMERIFNPKSSLRVTLEG
jgi:hypothetical protein